MKFFKLQKLFLALIMVSMYTMNGYGINEKVNHRILGSDFSVGKKNTIIDNKFNFMELNQSGANKWDNTFIHKNIKNTVTLAFDRSKPWNFYGVYTLQVELKITYWDETFTQQYPDNVILEVIYDGNCGTTYSDMDLYIFNDALKIEAEIVSITETGNGQLNLMQNAYLEVGFDIDRFYAFDYTGFPVVGSLGTFFDHRFTDRELDVHWEHVLGAVAYDLEWTFVSDYHQVAPTSLNYDFDNRATRVRISETQYSIPIVYDKGYLLYRLRPIGRTNDNSDNYQTDIEGRWTTYNGGSGYASGDLLASNDFTNNCIIKINDLGTGQDITPQGQTSNWLFYNQFMDQGKQVSAMQYLDGTGKVRQEQASNHTHNEVMVGASVYDHNGRPAITVMPAPVNGKENFNYVSDLSKVSSTGNPLSNTDFDTDTKRSPKCTLNLVQLDAVNSKGSANYYSSSNADKDGAQAFVPDGNGYTYSRVEYMPDNTGRLFRQGGVGETYQLGSDHETFYNYTDASSEILSTFFEAGNRADVTTSYKQVSTTDANKQTTVTVYDVNGNINVTRLSGSTPSNLDQLPNYTGPVLINKQLTDYRVSDDPLEVKATIPVSAGAISVSYDFDVTDFSKCNLCYSCVYDLEIYIEYKSIDGCTTYLFIDQTQKLGTAATAACPGSGFSYSTGPHTYTALTDGSVRIIKKMKINTDAVKQHLNTFSKNSCPETIRSFIPNFEQDQCLKDPCTVECELVWEEDYAAYLLANPSSTLTAADYAIEKKNCIKDCGKISHCEYYKDLLRKDFYPGGQYATYEVDKDGVYSCTDQNSILYGSGSNIADFSSGSFSYTDVDGYNVTVTTIEQYVNLFNSKYAIPWTDQFLQYHPEYNCLDLYCKCYDLPATIVLNCDDDTYKEGYFKDLMLSTSTFEEAVALGLFNPLGQSLSTLTYFPVTLPTGSGPSQLDKYFALGGSTAAGWGFNYLNDMSSFMINTDLMYSNTTVNPQIDYNIWAVALILANAWDIDLTDWNDINNFLSGRNLNVSTDVIDLDDLDCDKDRYWMAFRSLYLHKRNEIEFQLRDDYCRPVIANGKTRVFPNFNDLFGLELPNLYTSDPTAIINNSNTLVGTKFTCADLVDDTKAAYVIGEWNDLLDSCSLLATDPNRAHIINAFKEIVKCACSSGYVPMGAQDCPDGITYGGNTFYTFQEVMDYYVTLSQGANWEDDICNVYILKNFTFAHPVSNYTYLDKCGCDLIKETHDDYVTLTGTSSLPLGVEYEYEYFQYVLGFEVDDVPGKLCDCEEAYEKSGGSYVLPSNWNATREQDLADLKVIVPDFLQCSSCIGCDVLDYELTNTPANGSDLSFQERFPWLSASSSNYWTMVQQFLNEKLKLELTVLEYQQLNADCDLYSANSRVVNIGVTDEAADLLKFLNQQIWFGDFTNTTTSSIDIDISNDFYYGTLFQFKPDPDVNKLIEFSTTRGTNYLEMDLNDKGLTGSYTYSCNIHLDDPVTSFDYNTITKFVQIEADLQSTTAGSTVYKFRLTAKTISGATEYIYGTSCFPIYEKMSANNKPQLCTGGWETKSYLDKCGNRTLAAIARNKAERDFDQWLSVELVKFEEEYRTHCGILNNENFPMEYNDQSYSATLYYYDLADNLVRTVPPKGVDPANPANHTYNTYYEYNTLNEMTYSETPDGGETQFWYDEFGRIVLSQNKQQKKDFQYAYTLYDVENRIVESGIMTNVDASNPTVELTAIDDDMAQNPNTLSSFLTPLYDASPTPACTAKCRTEVVHTIYDFAHGQVAIDLDAALDKFENPEYHDFVQENLRGRVASVIYQDVYAYESAQQRVDYNQYTTATHYSYDDHGNVKYLIQDNADLKRFEHDKKIMKYSYDLVAGQVSEMVYQQGEADQLYHRYSYDADNRLNEVLVSNDGEIWEKEADYKYMAHGPLARTEVGQDKYQGVDYAYTLQGWLKGVNSTTMNRTRDIGQDANTGDGYLLNENDLHRHVGHDAFGFSLGYHEADYSSIENFSTAQNFLAEVPTGSSYKTAIRDLYNGNISHMEVALTDNFNNALPIYGREYRYDQLNRITASNNFTGSTIETNNTFAATPAVTDYNTTYSYDPNGNLLTLNRNAYTLSGTTLLMDQLAYIPKSLTTNQLDGVIDGASGSGWGVDLESQAGNNYQYDDIGRLIADVSEDIGLAIPASGNGEIEWTSRSKVKAITRKSASNKYDLDFTYSPDDQRVSKVAKPKRLGSLLNELHWEKTYYVRDHSGNPIAVYNVKAADPELETYKLFCLDDNSLMFTYVMFEDPATSISGPATDYSSYASASDAAYHLANQINLATTTPNFYAVAVGPCIKVFAYDPQTDLNDVSLVTYVSDPNEAIMNPGTLVNGGGNKSLQLTLAEHHLYGSKRLAIEKPNLMVAEMLLDPYIESSGGEIDWENTTYSVNQKHKGRYMLFTLTSSPMNPIINDLTNLLVGESFHITMNGEPLFPDDPAPSCVGSSNMLDYFQYLADQINANSVKYRAYVVDNGGGNYTLYIQSLFKVNTATLYILDSYVNNTLLSSYAVPSNSFINKAKFTKGRKYFEMTNHLGNVLEVVTDRRGLAVNTTVEVDDDFHKLVPLETNLWTTTNGDNWHTGTSLRVFKHLTSTTAALKVARSFTTTASTSYEITIALEALSCNDFTINVKDGATVIYTTTTGTDKFFKFGITASGTQLTVEIENGTCTGGGEAFKVMQFTVAKVDNTDPTYACVDSYNDYYPFGMVQPGRNGNSGNYRYGFQGQETDDEFKGQGNSVNYKYRMHDPRLGRFFSVDPLAGEFAYNSPYAFSENRVIDGIELEGLEVVVLFGGGDLVGNGSTGTAKAIANTVAKRAEKGTTVVLLNSNYNKPIQVVMAAAEEVMNNHKPGKPVIIYGYSKGGEYAQMLAKQLKLLGIEVELLVTVDAADGPLTFTVDREISDNVKENKNYYQDKGSLIFSEGDPNTAEDETKTKVENINMTGETYTDENGNEIPIEHSTIDEATQGKVEDDLIEATKKGSDKKKE